MRYRKFSKSQQSVIQNINNKLSEQNEFIFPGGKVEMYEKLFPFSDDIFFVLDNNLRFVFVGSKFCELLNIENVLLDNTPIMCYLSTESYIDLKKITSQISEKDENYTELSVQLLNNDRQIVHVKFRLKKVLFEEKHKTFFMGLIQTVKLKQAELNSDKNIYLQALEAGSSSIMITDTSGIIVHVNKALCKKSGYLSEELIGHKVRNFGSGLIPNVTDLWITTKNGNVWHGEAESTTKSGEKYWELITVAPLFDREGQISNYVAFKEDITTLKDKYLSLENSSKNLSEKVAFRDKLFSLISHDLRNSVGNLKNISMILNNEIEEQTPSTELIQKYSSLIFDSSTTTYSMLENLLSWSKSQFINSKTKSEVVDIEDVIRHNIEMFNNLAVRKEITLECQIGNFTEVFADLQAVNSVVRNLLTNAIKFTYPNGKIVISVDEYEQEENMALISVADNGMGMTEDQKIHLFENNHLNTTMGTSNEKGTGLGLILCRDLVEKNGGTIWVDSNIPQGTIFYFTLPFA
ncbi:MAG: ATP-binding protein [Bacteroidales bacterium]|nr:ATP-binding protein [Bacteroidales bacterium]